MGFWGIEVKPGKPYPYHADNIQGKLHVTHATLGIGSSNEKTILQCSSGHKSPIFLCSLLPNKIESCPLNLEFGDDDLVAFSVIGPQSIHLSGYFVADDGDDLRDDYEYDSFPEDVEGDTEDSSDYDTEGEYDDDYTDDSDMEIYRSSPVPNSGVRIEEIVDDEMPENEEDPDQKLKKKKQEAQMKEKVNKMSPIRGETGHPVSESEEDDMESEDEDGFPISAAEKVKFEVKGNNAHKTAEEAGKNAEDVNNSPSLKRKVESADGDEPQQQDRKKKKKKNKLKEPGKGESAQAPGKSMMTATPDEKHPEEKEVKTTEVHDEKPSNEELVEKKKKNKKKNKAKESHGGEATPSQIDKPVENKLSASEKKGKKQETEAKPSQVRTFPNGLVIEEISMGKPDGKRAAPGKKVSVKYIGKLQKNGKIFDSNVGRAPFKFHLGVGQVIKGWDIGVNGMRVGDKRRITVPPSMGYGDRRVGSIPPNSWLVFDVELINVDR
ncbi:peptidyl-prolyl cis-trans isomerase FKBP53 [Arachis stenosperma]|uniref:peptidyl-prolyl cis-trans isomerase FKBP53 n=1 Tax=Arachis stenosperma TaxID=217475 RepID=UPI0025ACCDDF|nr:peptidyl-prolyl cis-trans isomerase FKBP53 [Arachis stenosperma]